MKWAQSHWTQLCLSMSSLLLRSALRSLFRTMPLQPELVHADVEKFGRSLRCGTVAVQKVTNGDTTDFKFICILAVPYCEVLCPQGATCFM